MTIRLLDVADRELRYEIEYYEECEPGLGLALLDEFESSLVAIVSTLLAWPESAAETRRKLLLRFPFAIHYLLQADTIWIVAFAHQKQRPLYWIDRLTGLPS